jgi:hypothetical protein
MARETSGNELSLWTAKISGTVLRLHKLLAGDARNEGSDRKDYEFENPLKRQPRLQNCSH